MDNIPYDDYDHPFWEDEDDILWNLLEPSDFYFYIPEGENSPYFDPDSDLWYISIVPKKLFDEQDIWFDQHLSCHTIAEKHGCTISLGCNDETTYSLWPEQNVTKEQVRAELERIGFIWHPKLYDGMYF
jgi:hypothetical protein